MSLPRLSLPFAFSSTIDYGETINWTEKSYSSHIFLGSGMLQGHLEYFFLHLRKRDATMWNRCCWEIRNELFHLLLPRWQRLAQVLLDAVTMTTLILSALCWFKVLKIKSSCKVCLNFVTFIVIVTIQWVHVEGNFNTHRLADCIMWDTSSVRIKLPWSFTMTLKPVWFLQDCKWSSLTTWGRALCRQLSAT